MLKVIVNENNTYSIERDDSNFLINGENVEFDAIKQNNGLYSVLCNGKSYTALFENIDRKNKIVTIRINGQVFKTEIREPLDVLLSNMGLEAKTTNRAESVKAPMPGLVLKILVNVGQTVNKGDALIVLEAMKMENILKASGNATVKAIKVGERTAVEKGAVLIEFE